MDVARLPHLAAPAATAAAALAGCVTIALVDPNQPGRYPTCPYLALTGLPCPGCGTLRALHALSRGDVVAAASFNLLLVAVVLPLLAWTWIGWARHRSGRRAAPPTTSGRAAWTLAAAVAAFWLLRSLPLAPLTWLAP